jgi:hypothetical protein
MKSRQKNPRGLHRVGCQIRVESSSSADSESAGSNLCRLHVLLKGVDGKALGTDLCEALKVYKADLQVAGHGRLLILEIRNCQTNIFLFKNR